MADIDRLMDRVVKDPVSHCWLWYGAISDKGYGCFNITNPDPFAKNKFKRVLAHRFSFAYHKGPLAKGEELGALCPNRNCVNPDHWVKTTQATRSKISWDSGNRKDVEYKTQVGAANRNARLTEEQIIEIKSAGPEITNMELARIYKVRDSHISNIRRNLKWKNINGAVWNIKPKKMTIFCATCGSPFETNKKRYETPGQPTARYCSKDCYTIRQENEYGIDAGKARMKTLRADRKRRRDIE